MKTFRLRRLLLAAVVVALVASGCGDDDNDEEATDESTTATTAPEASADSGDAGDSGDVVEVTAVDYEFEGLPKSVKAGTKLSLTNKSDKELHELVAFVLPEGEDRDLEELVNLPEGQLESLFSGPPETVLIAKPSSDEQIEAVGDGTLTKPGRYLVFCAIPTGVDPQAYLDAVKASEGQEGPPEVEGGGPPHFIQGMYGEITVE